MGDKIQEEFKTKEEERLTRIFTGVIKTDFVESPTQDRHEEARVNQGEKMQSEEEKRLAARYLTTDNNLAPPKPKWDHLDQRQTQSAPVSPAFGVENHKLTNLNLNRPSFKKASEVETLSKKGLTEEQMIAQKKKELEQKAYLKKKKDDAKDTNKWREKELEQAQKDKELFERRKRDEEEAKQQSQREAENRRRAEAELQAQREKQIYDEANRHANSPTAYKAPEKTHVVEYEKPTAYLEAEKEQEKREEAQQAAGTQAGEKWVGAQGNDDKAKQEEARLKARWLI